MERRHFIKSTFAASFVFGSGFSWAGSLLSPALLLEAGQFQNWGGWNIDQQFMDQMGSGFLLAHGLGKPVEDAVAKVKFFETGKYKLFVRTRDWVAPWKKEDTPPAKKAVGTPGIFNVLINGQSTGTVFGNTNEHWHWQEGGIVDIQEEEVEISLRDLTGFGGRCAAVFFTKDRSLIPPDKGEELARFRRKWHGYSEKPENAGHYDFVVVGGGVAGMCAVVIAARKGMKVALIHDRPVIGGNNSSEVRMFLSGAGRSPYSKTLGDVLSEIDVPREKFEGIRPMHTKEAFIDDKKSDMIWTEKNIEFFPMYRMNSVKKKGDNIQSITAEHIADGSRIKISGDLFADCTGDANMGFLAGADFEISKNEHMGRSNQWSVAKVDKMTVFPRCPWALDLSSKPFPGRPGYIHHKEDSGSYHSDFLNDFGDWYWESGFNHDPIEKGEYIRDWNWRAMYGAWDCIRNVEKAYPEFDLVWAAFISGMRESRRLLGDLILNKEDVTKPNWYDDGIVPTGWKIDVHFPNPRYEKGFEGDAFISTVHFEKCVKPYYVPYRCLYSRNVPNLFMAGRDISVTRDALGCVRVMRTTALMGEVIGYAASICKTNNESPRDVYKKHLRELKEACGMDPDVIAVTETV